MMLVWNNLADPHLSAFSHFAWFSQTVTLNYPLETTHRNFFRASESQTERLKLTKQGNFTHDPRSTAQSPSLFACCLSVFSSQIAVSRM